MLTTGKPLTAWLYLVTRRAALNALRAELRRQAREHAAYELSTMHPVPSVWEKLAPQLDEALETLNPRDRSALLLRYFENKPQTRILRSGSGLAHREINPLRISTVTGSVPGRLAPKPQQFLR